MILSIHLPDPPNTRRCFGPDDWGDDATIGKHLKRRVRDKYFKESDFAIYLGANKVAIKGTCISITYNSTEEMKKEWILD